MQPQNSAYDFLNTPNVPKKSTISSQTTKGRILLFGGLIVILIIIVTVIFSVLSGGGDNAVKDMTSIAQQQNELVRITTLGAKDAQNIDTQNLALTTQLSLQTDQNKIVARLKAAKKTIQPAILAATKDSAVDSTLSQAKSANSYDETFKKILLTRLQTYQQLVKRAYDTSNSTATKQVLSDCFKHANTLVTELSKTN